LQERRVIAHYLAVFLVDLGLVLGSVGAISLIRPLRFLRIPSRSRALGVLGAGALLVVVGCVLPASETSVGTPRTELDRMGDLRTRVLIAEAVALQKSCFYSINRQNARIARNALPTRL